MSEKLLRAKVMEMKSKKALSTRTEEGGSWGKSGRAS